MFDIHKVKPIHGWRDFIGEVGIIVLGVLIALGAEQIVETFHQRDQLAETRGFLDDSLADAKSQALARIVMGSCLNARLQALRTDIETGRAARGEHIPHSPITDWQTGPWNTAIASGALLHMKLSEKSQYDTVFEQMAGIQDWNNKEYSAWSEIHLLEQPTKLTDSTRDRLIADIATAKDLNRLIVLESRQLYKSIKELDVHLGASEMEQLHKGEAYLRRHQCRLPTPLSQGAKE